jgi:hypothetical protein
MGTFGSYREKSTNSRIAEFLRKKNIPMSARDIANEMVDVTKYNVYAAYRQGQIIKHVHKRAENALYVDPEYAIRHVWEHSDDCFRFSPTFLGKKGGGMSNPSTTNPIKEWAQIDIDKKMKTKFPLPMLSETPKPKPRKEFTFLDCFAVSVFVGVSGLILYSIIFRDWLFAAQIITILALLSFVSVFVYGIYIAWALKQRWFE